MLEIIENFRKKSDGAKKQVAFLVSLFIAGIIFVLWLGVIYPDIKNTENKEVSENSESSPISTFGSIFSAGLESIGTQFNQIKNIFKETKENSSQNIPTSTLTSKDLFNINQ